MKIRSLLLCTATLLVSCLVSNASVTGVTYADDGDGAVICPVYTWPGGDTVSIYGDQYGWPGHVLGTISTDSDLDPTLTLASAFDNDTPFVWTDYHVNIFMNHVFTVVPASVSVFNDSIGDWTGGLTQQATSTGTNYMAKLDFYAGTPVPIGDTLYFSYAIQFSGATSFSFTQEMIPTPEPSTLSLLAGGALLLGARTLRRKH